VPATDLSLAPIPGISAANPSLSAEFIFKPFKGLV